MKDRSEILKSIVILGDTLRAFLSGESLSGSFDFTERIAGRIKRAEECNPWFTEIYVRKSIKFWADSLTENSLNKWLSRYPQLNEDAPANPRKVAVVMAGNIPMVGMHDFLCCLIAGHHVMAKLSSDDAQLIPLMADILVDTYPDLKNRITFTTGLIEGFDAVIATGSDNTSRYFEYYFGKYPNIIRKNRNSIAILDGTESFNNLDDLCYDIFDYFGMGCRSVSKLFVPSGYDFSNLTLLFDAFNEIGNHNKYRNNYDYRKSVLLINRTPFIDHHNLLLVENSSLKSPLAVLHYEEYEKQDYVAAFIGQHRQELQCVVCNNEIVNSTTPFGHAQRPVLWDYADSIDTLQFLFSLK